MNRNLTIFSIFCLSVFLCQLGAPNAFSESGLVYNSRITYPGIYQPNALYRKSRPQSNWRSTSLRVFPDSVQCTEARQSLTNTGLWHGTLLPNGTCVTGEAADWATGNRINFDHDQRR